MAHPLTTASFCRAMTSTVPTQRAPSSSSMSVCSRTVYQSPGDVAAAWILSSSSSSPSQGSIDTVVADALAERAPSPIDRARALMKRRAEARS